MPRRSTTQPRPRPGPTTADDDRDPWAAPPHEDEEPVIYRNPPRDWAAPPPWATGAGAAAAASGAGGARPSDAPDFLASRDPARGLAGSAADRLAGGSPAVPPPTPASSASPSAPASDDLVGLVGAAGAAAATGARRRCAGTRAPAPAPLTRPPSGAYPTTTASGRRPTVSSTRSRTQQHDGPSWESAKRYEAYPTIKTRAGLPGVPRIAVWAGALGVAALALFFLPALLGVGGGGGRARARAPAGPRRSPRRPRTRRRSPSRRAQTYTIKTGDTLLKIAKKFDLTLDELLAANKATIKNPDKIKVGQEIIIPVSTPDEVTDPSAAAPDDSATPEP